MQPLKKLIVKLLRETADKIDSGNCELSESEAMDIMSVLSHQAMLESYHVKDDGEAPAYTMGYLVSRMWEGFKQIL